MHLWLLHLRLHLRSCLSNWLLLGHLHLHRLLLHHGCWRGGLSHLLLLLLHHHLLLLLLHHLLLLLLLHHLLLLLLLHHLLLHHWLLRLHHDWLLLHGWGHEHLLLLLLLLVISHDGHLL